MVPAYTLQYLRTRSLPELYRLRAALQLQLANFPQGSVERSALNEALGHIHRLLATRGPGYGPR